MIEMLAVVVILGILLAIGIPGVRGIFNSNRMATHLNQLSTAFLFARSEAIKRVSPVAIGTSAGWASDWSIWVDDGLNPGTYDAGSETQLRIGTATASGITLTGTVKDSKSNVTNLSTLVYEADGTIKVLDSGGVLIVPTGPVTFTLCYSGQKPRILTFSPTGRPKFTVGTSVCS